MRYVLLPLALVSLACGAVSTRERATPPRPLVLLVHGRGQLDVDTASLRRDWQRELNSSLASVGLPRLEDGDVRLAWYADLLDPEVSNECVRPVDTLGEGGGDIGFDAIARFIFASLVSAIPKNESRNARGVVGELLYFLDASARCAARLRVGRQIQSALASDRPVVVVAYSMGALVAYDYLSSADRPDLRGDLRLITLGSPLGLREIRSLLFGEALAALPRGVTSWVNVYDPGDPFAAPLGAAPPLEDRRTQTRYDGDAHYAGRYLRDASTGAALGRALCATSAVRLGEACKRL
ncbi:MAG: hypothetical protein WD801_10305 [Gemmatimonadaceae bacterium]